MSDRRRLIHRRPAGIIWYPGRVLAFALLLLMFTVSNVRASGRSIFLPHLIVGMGFETEIVLSNPSSAGSQVVLTARGDNGALLTGEGVRNPATLTVGAHQEVRLKASELLVLPPNVLSLGWIEADSDNSQITAQFSISTSAQGSGAGLEAGDSLQSSFAGAIPAGLQTAITLTNPNTSPAAVTLELYDAQGQQRGQSTFTIPVHGHRAQFLNDGSTGATSLLEGGHFEINSSVGLVGAEVVTGFSGYALSGLTAGVQGPLVFPRVINSVETVTSLILENTSDFAVQINWRAWDSQGQALNNTDRIPMSRTIPAHGTYSGTLASTFGLQAPAEFEGTVQAELIPSPGHALEPARGTGLVIYKQGSGIGSLAGQLATAGVFLLTQGSGFTNSGNSFLVLNPSETLAQVTIVSYGLNGNLIGNTNLTLAPHRPQALDGNLPSGTAMILLRANSPVVGFQAATDSKGVVRMFASHIVPPQVGGVVPLNAKLGGTVLAADARASVSVPLGALDTDVPITISSLTTDTAPSPPIGFAIGAAFQVSPLGLHFRQPVTLEFPVLSTFSFPVQPPFLMVYDPETKAFTPTSVLVSSGVGGTTLIAQVSDFPQGPPGTIFVVLIPIPGPGVVAGGGGGGGGGGGAPPPSGGGGGVPTAGGVVTSSDGQASVVIPPGALPAATPISVVTISPSALPNPGNSQSVLLAIQVGPSGLQFNAPVTIRFNVPSTLQGRLPKQLPLQVFNPLTNKYDSTGFQASLSTDGTKLTASVTHFTVFVVLQPFTPFSSPILKTGTTVRPLGIASLQVPPIPLPVISSFSPTSGSVGSFVNISGFFFTGVTAVTIAGAPAASFTFNNDSSITAQVNGSLANNASGLVTVTTLGGTGTSAADATPNFTVTPNTTSPTVSGFNPTSGVPAIPLVQAGTTVTITGSGFFGVTSVDFAGVVVSSFTPSLDGTSITTTVPSGSFTGPIHVTTAGGTGTSGSNFSVVTASGIPINFSNVAGVLLPSASLTVANLTTGGARNPGVLLPSASLTVANFVTGGARFAGVLLPSASLTVNNPSIGGSRFPGILLPAGALTISNIHTSPTGGAGGVAIVIKGSGFWDGNTALPTLGPTNHVSSVNLFVTGFGNVPFNNFTVTDGNTIVAEAPHLSNGGIQPPTNITAPISVVSVNGSVLLQGSNTSITGTGSVGAPSTIQAVGGNGINGVFQSATHGTQLLIPFTVLVTDSNGLPVSGQSVSFAVATGGGSLTVTNTTTDAHGMASTKLTLGPAAGSNTVTATALNGGGGNLTGSPVTFTATGN